MSDQDNQQPKPLRPAPNTPAEILRAAQETFSKNPLTDMARQAGQERRDWQVSYTPSARSEPDLLAEILAEQKRTNDLLTQILAKLDRD